MSQILRFRRPGMVGLCLVLLAFLITTATAPLTAETDRWISPDVYKTGVFGEVILPTDKSPEGVLARLSDPFEMCAIHTIAKHRPQRLSPLRGGSPTYTEIEPNDDFDLATYYPLGTTPDLFSEVRWTGDFGDPPSFQGQEENDDSTGLANPTPFVFDWDGTLTQRVAGNGTIGDGLFGATTGDFDFFAVPLATGSQLVVEAISDSPFGGVEGDLDPVLAIFDRFGNLIRVNDDQSGFNSDPRIMYSNDMAPQVFYIMVGGAVGTDDVLDALPRDATTDNSGISNENRSSGDYRLEIGVNPYDVDIFRTILQAGDVLSLRSQLDARVIQIWGPDGGTTPVRLAGAQEIDRSSLLPDESPLLRGGRTNFQYVVQTTGDHYIVLAEPVAGDYILDAQVSRPGAELDEPGLAHQVLFIDYDGATIAANEISGSNAANLTPFNIFFESYWNNRIDYPLAGPFFHCEAEDGDEDPMTNPAQPFFVSKEIARTIMKRKITDRVIDVLDTNLRDRGENGDFNATWNPGEFNITVLNSDDHRDPWGEENVSRVIVGGTIGQLGIQTIGIAASIDPGNFEREESAVVLMDLLSEVPSGYFDPNEFYTNHSNQGFNSLNAYLITYVDPICIDLGAWVQTREPDPEDPEDFGDWEFKPDEVEDYDETFIEEYFFNAAEINTPYDLIATTIGNITAHEAVHFLGGYHTTNQNDVPNIIDEGGSLPNSWGDGGDGYFGRIRVDGTEEDPNPDPLDGDDTVVYNVSDLYSFNEGIFGQYDTGINMSHGLASGRQFGTYVILPYNLSGETADEEREPVIAAVTGEPFEGNVLRGRQGTQPLSIRIQVNETSLTGTGIDILYMLGGELDDVFNAQVIKAIQENNFPPDPTPIMRIGGTFNATALGDVLNFEPLGGEPNVTPESAALPGLITVNTQDGVLQFRGIETLIPTPNELFGVVVR